MFKHLPHITRISIFRQKLLPHVRKKFLRDTSINLTHILHDDPHIGSGGGDGADPKDDSSQNEFILQYMKQQKQLIENAESSLNSSSQESDVDNSPQKLQSSYDKLTGFQSQLETKSKMQKQANTNKETTNNAEKSKNADIEKSAQSEMTDHDREKWTSRGRCDTSCEQNDKTDSHNNQNQSSKARILDKEERDVEGKPAKKITNENKENARAMEVKEQQKRENIDQRKEKPKRSDAVYKERANKQRAESQSRSRSPKIHHKKISQEVQSSMKRNSSSSSGSNRSRSRSKGLPRRNRHVSSSSSSSRSRSRSLGRKKLLEFLPQRNEDKKLARSSSSSRSRSRSLTPASTNRSEVEVRLEVQNQPKSKSPESQKERKPSTAEIKSTQAASKTTTENEFSISTAEPSCDKMKEKETVTVVKVSETKEGAVGHELLLSQSEVKAAKKISLNRNTMDEPGDGEKAEVAESKPAVDKPAKKRKWGSHLATFISQKPKKTSSIPISTESLKNLIPDVKLSLNMAPEPIMEDEMDYEDDTISMEQPQPIEQDNTRSIKIQRTIKQNVKEPADKNESDSDSEAEQEQETPTVNKLEEECDEDEHNEASEDSGEDNADRNGDNICDSEIKENPRKIMEEVSIEKKSNEDVAKSTKTLTVTTMAAKPKAKKDKNKEIKVIRRLDSGAAALIQPDEPQKPERSPSPPRYPVSKIVHIRNLVRPFTINQLKELLRRQGNFNDNDFWIDKIKSHCFATFETEDQALVTRRALHNTRWPNSNPKTLIVDFGSEEQLEYYRGDEKPIPPPEKKPRIQKEKYVQDNKEEERQRLKKDEKEKEIERRRREREKRLKDREVKENNKKTCPVRDWDKDKKSREDWDTTLQKSRSRSPKRQQSRSPKRQQSRSPKRHQSRSPKRQQSRSPKRQRSRSLTREGRKEDRSGDRSKERLDRKRKEKKDEPPAKLLDDLFRKTTTTPCIYWLPLTEAQIAEKEKLGMLRPVLHRNQEGDCVNPMRDIIPETEKKPHISSPVANTQTAGETWSPVRPRQRQSSPEHRRKESNPDTRSRSNKK